ncbi:MAG: 2-oxo acid dehydrogenase subunit E2 [Pseudomonadota bacterium]
MKVFNLPDLGEGLPDATIVRWLVNEGDKLSVDQPMVEMETAKAVVEVPSPFEGVVSELKGQAGDVIQVGDTLVIFNQNASEQKPEPTEEINKVKNNKVTANTAKETKQIFYLPDLGEGLQDAEVVRWLKSTNDDVKVDEPLVEMETDKAVVEVPSPYSGVITKLYGEPGELIRVGSALVEFNGENNVPAAEPQEEDAGTVVGAVEVGHQVTREPSSALVKALARKLRVDLSSVQGTGKNGAITQNDVKAASEKRTASLQKPTESVSTDRHTHLTSTQEPLNYRASPAVRALARKLGVNLANCETSGKKGSITQEDVKACHQKLSTTSRTPQLSTATLSPSKPVSQGLPDVTISPESLRGARRAMAVAMTKAQQQVCLTTLVDDANIHFWKGKNNPTVRLIRAVAQGCLKEPALNAWFDGEKLERLVHPHVHIGIAVDMPDGLYVPVIRHAERKTAAEIRFDLNHLIEKIQNKTIRPEDMANPTITLSNFGTIAGQYATPVVLPPQVAIIGAGSFKEHLKLTSKGIENQKHIPLSLSFDHRACTGGEAARCLKSIMEDLSLPE